MIKLTNRQQFNTFCILSNHGNDIKTFKTRVEHRAAGKVKSVVLSFRYKVVLLQVVSLHNDVHSRRSCKVISLHHEVKSCFKVSWCSFNFRYLTQWNNNSLALSVAYENIRFSSLFASGDVSFRRETSTAATSEEKRMFSLAMLYVYN